MPLIVLGNHGQVGWELCRQAEQAGVTVIGFSHSNLDITDAGAVTRAVGQAGIEGVINAAAYTAVDRAESEAEQAYAVNRDGVGNLARACAAQGIPLIHISTDYVFDGSKTGAYDEDDEISPLGVYGDSKAAGEVLVREVLEQHIILRTAWVYGVWGNNFVKTMLRLARERDVIKVVDDQYGCPTAAGDIAAAILQVVRRLQVTPTISWGTYHYCGAGVTTWYQFAQAVFEMAGRYQDYTVDVVPIPSSEYPTPVKRPANSVLDTTRIHSQFGIAPRAWPVALAEVIRRLYESAP